MKKFISITMILALMLSSFIIPAYAEDMIDIAANRVASASSSADGAEAGLANDGINDNELHTYWKSAEGDSAAWWQTDLGQSYQILKVTFEPRVGAPDEEKSNFEIIASNSSDFGEYTVIFTQKDVLAGNLSEPVNLGEGYRYVRVRKLDEAAFSIGEVGFWTKKSSIPQGAEASGSLSIPYFDTDEYRRYVTPPDVVGTKYERSVSLLSQLNIMRGYEDGSFQPERRVTRAEIAAVVSRMLSINTSFGSQTYSDVPKSHWAYENIENCTALGLVNGVGGGLYSPSEYVSRTQILKILVCMLGYGTVAEENSGYPVGYLSVAADLKLNSNGSEEITRGEIADLLVQALDVNILQQTSFGERPMLETEKGETLLTNHLGLNEDSGIITASGRTSLTSAFNKEKSAYVEIDGVRYSSEIPVIENYIGYSVDYYYSTEDGEPYEIIAVLPRRTNDVVVISSEDKPRFEGDKLYYLTEDGEDEENITIPTVIDVIYNGAAFIKDYEKNELIPESGEIKAIDNDGDGEWDVLVVTDEQTHIVKWSSLNDEAIYVMDSTEPLKFDSSRDMVSVINGETGAEMSLDEIKEWNIVSAAESYNPNGAKIWNIIVSQKFVRGMVTEIGADYMVIDSGTYSFYDSARVDEIEVGDIGFFYLDYKNRVAAFDGSGYTDESYGFLRGINESTGIDDDIEFRIFTEDGEFVTYLAAEKLKVDGKLYDDKSEAAEHIRYNAGNNSGAQVIKYTVSGKGLVTSIDTTYQTPGYEDETALKMDFAAESRYYMSSNIFGMEFACDENTVMMRIPDDIYAEDQYELIPVGYFENSTQYTFEAYDAGSSNIMGLFVFRDSVSSSGVSNSARMFLVDEVTKELAEDGEALDCLHGYYLGEYVSYMEYSEGLIAAADLKRGDIIAISRDSKDRIKKIEKRFYPAGKPEGAPANSIDTVVPQSTTGPYSDIYIAYGTVMSKDGSFAMISFTNDTPYKEMLINLEDENMNIYVLDSERDKVRTGNKNDVLDAATVGTDAASKVFMYGNQGNIKDIIVFR